MSVEIFPLEDAVVVRFPAKFDALTAPDAEIRLRELLTSSPGKMILDFTGTEYVASAGLRVLLLVTREQLKAKRKVVLVGIRPQVLRIFDMAGFTRLFSIEASCEEALRRMA